MSSSTKEKGVGGASKERQTIHRKNGKSSCLVNKCLLGHTETMGQREDFYQTSLVSFLLTTTPSSYNVIIYSDGSFPGAGPLPKFF